MTGQPDSPGAKKLAPVAPPPIPAAADKLPAGKRDEADAILLDAAADGLPLEDLDVLARKIDETWKAQHPDPDDGNGDGGDGDGFEDRYLRLGTTFGGAGKVNGDLTTGCAAALDVTQHCGAHFFA